ncbi:MAG: NDP-sugar synthase [Dysgonamonadaceae bacterium]|jgi:NDP-sugar pyrophosphorylase family protein|nr:NDP-sugar synthase [Dysgonamonadaceae bacterium]
MNYAIIAAGEGSRLVQEGVSTPKPLVVLNNIPLINRLLDIFCRNGAESVGIIVNEKMISVRKYVESLAYPVPIRWTVQSTTSSLHSFYELSRFLKGGKFCLTTVDTVFKSDEFAAFIRAFENDTEHDGLLAVTDYIDDEKPLYVSIDETTGQILDFHDEPNGNDKYISGGIYGFTPQTIPVIERCVKQNIARMRNYQRQLIADGYKLKAWPFGKIMDIDHVKDIETAEKWLANEA